MMNDGIQYPEMISEFSKVLVEKRLAGMFLEMMRKRIDDATRSIVMTNDGGLTDIIKGQITICYELADGVSRALEADSSKAKEGTEEGNPDESW